MSLALRSLPNRQEKETSAPPLYRFTVEQYHRMIDAGVFAENGRAELLEGLVVAKMTRKPPHDVSVDLAQTEIGRVLPTGWRVRVQSAITLPDSEPEPDVAVVRGAARRYLQAHPRPGDIGMLAEVADATLLDDRARKKRIYAHARIAVYWIINLTNATIEVYTNPRAGRSPGYRQRQDYQPGDSVPLILDGRLVAHIPVNELLP